MRRCTMAFVLLVGIVGLSRADYVVIRVLLAPPPAKDKNAPEVAPPPKIEGKLLPPKDDYVQVVIEAKRTKHPVKEFNSTVLPFLEHKWGRTWDDFDGKEILVEHVKPKHSPKKSTDKEKSAAPEIILKPPMATFTERHEALKQGKDADGYLKLAAWCLEVGMPDKCQEVLNELETQINLKEFANPPPQVVEAMEAYKQVKLILSNNITKKTQADNWKQKLNYTAVAAKAHYALVHNSQDPVHDGIDRILNAMENNFRTFYLWFALKGKVLPPPREKLTAILTADMPMFRRFIEVFNVADRVNDGCHTLQENLVVFAPERLDKASQLFAQEMKPLNQAYASVELLNGKFRPLQKVRAKDQQEAQAILDDNNNQVKQDGRAQVMLLVEAALREEMENAVATHEGTRQLFVETGLMPANSPIPEWLRFGSASFFDTPKGPFASRNESIVKNAFWPSAGGPHWAWRPMVDEMLKDEVLTESGGEIMIGTLLNFWTVRAREVRAKSPEALPLPPEEMAELELNRGHCASWALVYFLMNDRFAEFNKFLTALNDLPRDVEIDRYTFLLTFCQSFGIDTTGMTPSQPLGNAAAYDALAKAWIESLRRNTALVVPLRFEEPKPDPKDKKGPNNMAPR